MLIWRIQWYVSDMKVFVGILVVLRVFWSFYRVLGYFWIFVVHFSHFDSSKWDILDDLVYLSVF